MSFNHYIVQPKPMLETLIKNLDKYPEKIKNT